MKVEVAYGSRADFSNRRYRLTVRLDRSANARKHIKPYVNPKVYGECVNQMTRGLPTRIAELQTKKELRAKDGKPTKWDRYYG